MTKDTRNIHIMAIQRENGAIQLFYSHLYPWVNQLADALAGPDINIIVFGEANAKGDVQWGLQFTVTKIKLTQESETQ